MSNGNDGNDWKEWSQHVLIELKRLNHKQNELNANMSSIDKTLSAQHVQLAEHIRRTELLEEAIQPVKEHVAMVNGGLKLIKIISIVVGIVAAIAGIITGVRVL